MTTSKIDQNEFFRQATINLCGSLAIDLALDRAFQYISRLLPLDHIILMRPDLDRRKMMVLAEVKRAGARLVESSFPLSPEAVRLLEGDNLPGLMIINDPQKHPIARLATGLGPADSSVILIRLTMDRKLIGSVAFRVNGRGRYTEEEARLLEPLREPFTVALSNYLRFQEVVRLKEQLAEDNRYLRAELQPAAGPQIVGAEFGLKGVMDSVLQVAPLNNPVLLLGETGTGKELVAGQLHHFSPRRDGPFIKVNCGAIPESLMDTELFGHERGAFTGAVSTKKGRFERAHGGTIFLDEVGELPLGAQVRMLRVLQEKRIERVGGGRTIDLDIRIIAATHRNIEALVSEGKFRKDLFYRLNVFPIALPALRERKGDIPLLVNHFCQKKRREFGLADNPIPEPDAVKRLMRYDWPGNVRELENVVERALIRCQGKRLVFEDLDPPRFIEASGRMASNGSSQALDDVVAAHIRRVLTEAGGRVAGRGGAAEVLRIHPSTLRAKMRKLGIPFGRRAGYGKGPA